MIKVILADNSKSSNRLLSLIDWTALNYEIAAVASSGADALDMIRLFNPDLIITDISLPDMSGTAMITQAQKIKYNIKFIITSENRDFNSLRFAVRSNVIDYLLKPVKKSELTQTLISFSNIYALKAQRHANQQELRQRNKGDIDRLRKCFFTDIIFPKDYSGTVDLSKINDQYYLNMDSGEFCSFIIKADGDYATSIYGKIAEIINDNVSICCHELALYHYESYLIYAASYPNSGYESIKNALNSCIDKFEQRGITGDSTSITIGLGGSSNSIIGLRHSYRYALEAIKHRLVAGRSKIIDFVPTYDHFSFNSIINQFGKSIAESVELLDVDSANSVMDKMKDYFDSHCETGTSYFKSMCLTAALFFININSSHEMYSDIIGVFTSFYDRIQSLSTPVQMFDALKQTVGRLFSKIIIHSKKTDILPIRIAKKYILDNYMHPISLEEVSKEVGFNPSYFSSMFKKECGVGFSEYLSSVRMNRAMSLLRETNLRVAEVCVSVGYTDLKHFTKTFKAKTGFSPTEFRKIHA